MFSTFEKGFVILGIANETMVHQRIQFLIRELGINVLQFAQQVGDHYQAIYRITNSGTKPSYDTISASCGLSAGEPRWLLLEQGRYSTQ